MCLPCMAEQRGRFTEKLHDTETLCIRVFPRLNVNPYVPSQPCRRKKHERVEVRLAASAFKAGDSVCEQRRVAPVL